MSETDAELVRAARAGDREAFGRLAQRYVRLAGAAAYAVVGEYQDAADVVQDALVKAHRRLGELRTPERFRSWLYGVVRTTALDMLRRRKRRPQVDLESTAIEGVDAGVEPASERLARAELARHVRAGVAELPEGYREVVALKYLDERSYDEIAELLGTTVGAVESRLHRARRMLRNKLGRLERELG
jgi:RNA polymerase sigma-70 factor (ECF subfamily)